MDQSFELIASCIDNIFSDDEVWAAEDCTKKEIKEFLEQMNSAQFKDIEKFFETMPKLSHKIKVTNPKPRKRVKLYWRDWQVFSRSSHSYESRGVLSS